MSFFLLSKPIVGEIVEFIAQSALNMTADDYRQWIVGGGNLQEIVRLNEYDIPINWNAYGRVELPLDAFTEASFRDVVDPLLARLMKDTLNAHEFGLDTNFDPTSFALSLGNPKIMH